MTELLDFSIFQREARKTALYPNLGSNLWYPALGLNGEAGEVAEKVKKLYRDSDGRITLDVVDSITRELGDVLWYVAAIASELKVDLNMVAWLNLHKLKSRAERDKVHGEGDER